MKIRKERRKGNKFGNGTEKLLQVIVLKGSTLKNLCKPYKTKAILHDVNYVSKTVKKDDVIDIPKS